MYVGYDQTVDMKVTMRNCIVANGYGAAYFGPRVESTIEYNLFFRSGNDIQVIARGREYSISNINNGLLGPGNIVGNPVLPVVKMSANPLTVETMSEHVDVDITGLLRFEYNLDGAADRTMDMMAQTINGRLTSAETLRHDDFVLTKLYRSA